MKEIKKYAQTGAGLGMALGGISMLKGGVQNVTPGTFMAGTMMGGIGGAMAGMSVGMLTSSMKKLSDTAPKKKGTVMDLF